MDAQRPVIVWLRNDLRLGDNPALHAAAQADRPVVPLFVLEEIDGEPGRGAAGLWWLHHSLAGLSADFANCGAPLVLRRGDPAEILPSLAVQIGASSVVWNRRYGWPGARDRDISAALHRGGVDVREHDANLLHDPHRLLTKSGTPFRVFTPFWRALASQGPPRAPLPAPAMLHAPAGSVRSDRLEDWGLLPTRPDWAGGLRAAWEPGERGAHRRLRRFVDDCVESYAEGRDRPDRDETSGLSPHLHFGEIGPVQVWQAIERANGGRHGESFLRQLGWRDFSHHQLEHEPALGEANFNARFDSFPWLSDPDALEAWRQGRTGYPVVDAGMRQLWATGWMHNRVRMIVASFLVKDLMIDWRDGAAWFHDTLVDADEANNAAGWQWVAGSGADAAPYFRVFNPVLQGERYDAQGDYVRQWLPELADLPNKYIHKPWEAPEATRQKAGVRLGETYPRPMLDHRVARQRALAVFQGLPGS